MKPKIDGVGVKAGDRLWHFRLGWLTVMAVTREGMLEMSNGEVYGPDGRAYPTDRAPCLFWDKPEIISGPPKKKACPFCGSEQIATYSAAVDEENAICAFCTNCSARGPRTTGDDDVDILRKKAIAAWNRRVDKRG